MEACNGQGEQRARTNSDAAPRTKAEPANRRGSGHAKLLLTVCGHTKQERRPVARDADCHDRWWWIRSCARSRRDSLVADASASSNSTGTVTGIAGADRRMRPTREGVRLERPRPFRASELQGCFQALLLCLRTCAMI